MEPPDQPEVVVDWRALAAQRHTDVFLRFPEPAAEVAYIAFACRYRRIFQVMFPLLVAIGYTAAWLLRGIEYFQMAPVIGFGFIASALSSVLVLRPSATVYGWLSRVSGIESQELLFSRVAEVIKVATTTVMAVGVLVGGVLFRKARCRDHHGAECLTMIGFQVVPAAILVLRPRFVFVLPILALRLAAGFTVEFLGTDKDAVTIALLQTVHLALLVIAAVIVAIDERNERRYFVEVGRVQQARSDLRARQKAIDALTRAALPPWVLDRFRTVASLDAATGADRSPAAVIGVCDVDDFAHWSTGLLPAHTVLVLHRLTTAMDDAARRFEVAKVAMFADTYTVVLGLGRSGQADGSDDAVGTCTIELQTQALVLNQRSVRAFVQWCVDSAAESSGLRFNLCGEGEENEEEAEEEDSYASGRTPAGGNINSVASSCESDSAAGTTLTVPEIGAEAVAAQAIDVVQLRGAVVTGPLSGSVAGGGASLKYVLAGAAVDTARELLQAQPGGSWAETDLRSADDRDNTLSGPAAAESEAHSSSTGANSLSDIPSDVPKHLLAMVNATRGHIPVHTTGALLERYSFSPKLLRFSGDEAQGGAMVFANETDVAAVPVVSACLSGLFAVGAAISVVQGLLPEDHASYRESGLNPTGLVLLLLASIGFGWRASVFALMPRLFTAAAVDGSLPAAAPCHVWIDHILVCLLLLCVSAANFFLDLVYFSVSPGFLFWTLTMLPQLFQSTTSWPVTAALNLFAGQAALQITRLWKGGEYAAYVPYSILSAPVATFGVIGGHYLLCRRLREHYAAKALATDLADAAAWNADVESKLLHALLPPHAAESALAITASMEYQLVLESRAPVLFDAPHVQCLWHSLVVVRGRFASSPVLDDFPDEAPREWIAGAARRWSLLVAAVQHEGEGRLQIVEGLGDDFTLAGPFDRASDDHDESGSTEFSRTDSSPRSKVNTAASETSLAAVAAVRLLNALRRSTAVPLQAAVTVGTASSALIGGRLLTYCLFGPAVREASAVLDAGAVLHRPVTFATPSFRRAFRGAFGAERRPQAIAVSGPLGPMMSYAFGRSADIRAVGASLPVSSDVPPEGDATFTAPLKWRLRAAGVMMVSTVRDQAPAYAELALPRLEAA